MADEFGMYFKQVSSKEEAFMVAIDFCKKCYENANEFIQMEKTCIPSIRNEKENDEADRYWLNDLFSFNFVFWPEYNILGLSGYEYPVATTSLFDIHFDFQWATDADYDYESWGNSILLFNDIVSKWKNLPSNELEKYDSYESGEDYCRKSMIYDEITSILSLRKWLYREDNPGYIYFTMSALTSDTDKLRLYPLLVRARKAALFEYYKMLADLIVDRVSFDSETCEAVYMGESYSITINPELELSAKMQAAIEIIKQKTEKKTD